MTWTIHEGDSRALLPTLPAASVDLLLADPPYPEISRPYGRLSETEWHGLMDVVVAEAKRLLKPSGSAVFVLQPNSKHVGQMRLWLWEFLIRTAQTWNLVQDVYWWNCCALPTVHCHRDNGLMRPSVKACLWFGAPDCYRDQGQVLLPISEGMMRKRRVALEYRPSGYAMRDQRCKETAIARGGTTPFNLLPIAATDSQGSSAVRGHGARTPYRLCEWWTRYACPPGGTVLDPFCGAGTVGLAAIKNGRHFIGIEKEPAYCEVAKKRLGDTM